MLISEQELKNITDKIINQIIDRRKELGLSQRQLAEKVGVPQSTISRIESKLVSPQLSTLTDIFRVLGLKPVLTSKKK